MVNANWLSGTFAGQRIEFLKQQPRTERPSSTLGEKWIRYDGVYELIGIEDDRYIFATENKRKIHLTKDLAVAKVTRGPRLLELDPPPALIWPLEIGKWGSSALTWRDEFSPAGGWAVRMTWRVVTYEEIKVVAGTFKAFRVEWSVEFPGGKKRELRSWYAPMVRQFVKAEGYDMGLLPFEVVAVSGEVEPLAIVLEQPEDGARLATESVVVAGKVRTGTRLERVLITINGNAVPTSGADGERAPLQGELVFELPIKLSEGKNVVLVTAEDSSGDTRQQARVLFYEKATGASSPADVTELESLRIATAPTSPPAGSQKPEPPEVAAKPAPVPTAVKPVDAKPSTPPASPVPPVAQIKPPGAAPGPVARPLPPALQPFRVALSSPRDQARVEHETVGLAGLVAGGEGVSGVVVTLNGIELSRSEERTPRQAMAVNLPVKLREGQNTLVVTATEAGGRTHQEVRTVHYDRLVPLTVAFRYPEDKSQVSEESNLVVAIVTASKGVATVRVTLNGAEVYQQVERASPKSVVVTAPVTLQEGTNAIVLTASEPDGTIRQEVRTVIYRRPQVAVAAPPPLPPPKPTQDRWAVIIGVGGYDSPAIPKLHYTVPDAEAIYQVLTGLGGFKREHVLLLTDKTERKPTLRNIRWALGTFLSRSAKKDDTVFIYFAGHGAPEVDTRGIERDGLSKYLAPSDADPEDLFSSALAMDDILTIFGRIEADRVVAFLDSCYSGAAGGRTFTSKKTRSGHVDEAFLERLTRSKGRAIITASRPAEVSMELPELGHGVFTYYLLQGLQGAADLNGDGIVTLQELYEYVEQQVSQKSRAVGGNQHPVMKGEMEGVLPLVKVKGR
jgi:hypothetical protein